MAERCGGFLSFSADGWARSLAGAAFASPTPFIAPIDSREIDDAGRDSHHQTEGDYGQDGR